MRLEILLLSFLLLPAGAPAQTRQYIGESGDPVDSADTWKYYEDITPMDNGWHYRKRYTPDGALVSEGAWSRLDEGIPVWDGLQKHYRNTGELYYTVEYVDGKRSGELRSYYPSGALKRIQRFTAGIPEGGSCFQEDGAPRAFTPFEQQPEYPGGADSMLQFLYSHIYYPLLARENGIQGTAVVSFVVGKDGSVTDIQVLRDPGGGIGAEAARVVGLMGKWTPGYQDDNPVKVRYTLPIKFSLESGRERRKKKKAGKS